MTKIDCRPKIKTKAEKVRVKVVKPPFVNTEELRYVLFARTKAVVL